LRGAKFSRVFTRLLLSGSTASRVCRYALVSANLLPPFVGSLALPRSSLRQLNFGEVLASANSGDLISLGAKTEAFDARHAFSARLSARRATFVCSPSDVRTPQRTTLDELRASGVTEGGALLRTTGAKPKRYHDGLRALLAVAMATVALWRGSARVASCQRRRSVTDSASTALIERAIDERLSHQRRRDIDAN